MTVDRHSAMQAAVLALLAVPALSGCVSLPTGAELRRAPSPHLAAGAPPGIVDGRAAFRPLFCKSLTEHPEHAGEPVDCDSWLLRLDDEPAAVPPAPSRPAAPMQVLLVSGAFSECFGEDARPFGSAVGSLRDAGFRVDTIIVGGRSGTEHNARELAEYLARWPLQADMPLVLIGYSKGASDILQFLVDFPEQAAHVSAVVSVAGSIGGSPLAETFDSFYDFTFSHMPLNHCPSADGEVVDSLRPAVRTQWLRDHKLPGQVHYYSIAAFTTRERVARALVPSWEILLKHGRRNDGQLLAKDELIPGSTVLGYLNADHWAVALDIEDGWPLLAHRSVDDPFPHLALLQAILQTVAADVRAATPASGD